MATRVLKIGAEFQVNVDNGGGNGISGNQSAPDVAYGGPFDIVYQSDFNGNASDQQAILSTPGLGPYSDLFNNTLFQGQPAVAGGGFVFTNERLADGSVDPTPNNIQFRTVTFPSTLTATITVGDFNTGAGTEALSNPDIATLAPGWVVVFERTAGATDHDIFLNVVNGNGTATVFAAGNPLPVANTAAWEANPAVASFGNEALVVFEDAAGTTIASANIRARLFNGASNTLAAAFTIADHSAQLFTPAVAALADNRYIIVYGDQTDLWGRIFDPVTPGGAFLADEFQIDLPGGSALNPALTRTVDGGFIVTWADDNGSDYDVLARRFDAHGASYGDTFVATTNTDNDQSTPSAASLPPNSFIPNGANLLFAWEDHAARAADSSPSGVRGQYFTTTAFDYDSAGLGDLDGNGRADILFQNDTGDVLLWQTSSSGLVSTATSLGQRPAGFLIFGTGNFNSTVGDDILLRGNAGELAIWPTSGSSVGTHVVIGSTSSDYHNAGIGDFTGDGQEDLLFRNDAGQIVTWGIVDNALAIAPQILGSTAPVYHIVGVDDFTGDGQSDILFRRDDGAIALWQVANNQIASTPKVIGSTSSSYHVVSTGDFDGNGANDILFRNDNGQVVEWLLNSSGDLLSSPTTIGSALLNLHIDGTGDLNGDGRDDIIVRDDIGQLIAWFMDGTSFVALPTMLGRAGTDYAIAAHHFDIV